MEDWKAGHFCAVESMFGSRLVFIFRDWVGCLLSF